MTDFFCLLGLLRLPFRCGSCTQNFNSTRPSIELFLMLVASLRHHYIIPTLVCIILPLLLNFAILNESFAEMIYPSTRFHVLIKPFASITLALGLHVKATLTNCYSTNSAVQRSPKWFCSVGSSGISRGSDVVGGVTAPGSSLASLGRLPFFSVASDWRTKNKAHQSKAREKLFFLHCI